MVDSSLSPENPQNASAQEQPGPGAASSATPTEIAQGLTPAAPAAAPAPIPEAPALAPEVAAPAPAAPAPIPEVPAPAPEVPAPALAAAPAIPEPAPEADPSASDAVELGSAAPVGAAVAPIGGAEAASAQPEATLESTPPVAEAPPASPPAGVASTITVPPLGEGAKGDGEGGEFDLLLQRVSQWLKQQDLPARWERLQGPLRGLALLLLAVVLLRLYGALIDTLDGLPLVPRLFQLVGVIVLVKFSLLNLVRTSDRERLISAWSQRWASFRGRV